MTLEEELARTWEERVDAKFLFRGMSRKDLVFPLDPARNPFADITDDIRQLLDTLQRAVDDGFHFELIETHGGNTYKHALPNIIKWSRYDVNNPSIDFTANHLHAREYADNWQGSQLKQNLRYLTTHLPERADDPVLRSVMQPEDWARLETIARYVGTESPDHAAVVIWVRRSCPVFLPDPQCPLAGTLDAFTAYMLTEIESRNRPASAEALRDALPPEEEDENHWFRLRRPLEEKYVEKVEGGS